MSDETVIRPSNELAEALKRAKHAQYMRSIGYTLHPDDYGDMRHLAELADEIDALQAKVDALMLEFCPGEMSEEQMTNWAKHQVIAHETSEQPPMPFKDWAADIRTQSMQKTMQAYKAKIKQLEYQLACRPSEKACEHCGERHAAGPCKDAVIP